MVAVYVMILVKLLTIVVVGKINYQSHSWLYCIFGEMPHLSFSDQALAHVICCVPHPLHHHFCSKAALVTHLAATQALRLFYSHHQQPVCLPYRTCHSPTAVTARKFRHKRTFEYFANETGERFFCLAQRCIRKVACCFKHLLLLTFKV